MAFCSKCGTQMGDDVKFCPSCGNSAPGNQQTNQQQYQQPNAGAGFNNAYQNITNTADSTGSYHPQDIAGNKAMAILAYLGILILVPIFAAKDSPFARFHSNQGLVLIIVEIALGIVSSIITGIILAISWRLYFLTSLISMVVWLAILAFIILGIINAATGKAKELPIIGKIRILR